MVLVSVFEKEACEKSGAHFKCQNRELPVVDSPVKNTRHAVRQFRLRVAIRNGNLLNHMAYSLGAEDLMLKAAGAKGGT